MELHRMEKEHDEKTLGIRLALKRAQIQVESLENALKTKVLPKWQMNSNKT
jgi:hypothetical protein